mmetsp:Transcript_15144/g.22919  ORF Transcript_15144/g.22919 Transcript_15144/m.22919 type:complete len:85 (+) Transcript_15144:456-710(+)
MKNENPSMLIMDHCPFHQSAGIAIQLGSSEGGAILLWLPAYHPQLNPIELGFNKFKALLKRERWLLFLNSHEHLMRTLRKISIE